MRTILNTLLIIFLLSQGCGNVKTEINQFTSSMDTLLIRTTKQRGSGLFTLGVIPAYFQDTLESFPYSIACPENIRNLKRMQLIADFSANTRNYIDIIEGKIGEDQVIIVDENNNKNLADDSVRIPQAINWHSEEDLIPCKYLISKGQEIVEDSSWLRLGVLRNNLWCGRSEHLIAEFWIDKEKYQVGIADPQAGDFTFSVFPEAALLSDNSIIADTLLERDKLKQGEILSLNDNYYRFENISYYGEYLTLIKEENFDKLVGIQVGMIAPDFTCVSVSGDTVKSSELHDKLLVIANSCGCGGDKYSTEAYYEILNEFGNKIHILHLDSKIDKNIDGLHIDMEVGYNQDIYLKYRNTYCSRTCYVLGTNDRILDKFPVTDWNHHLPELIK